MCTRVSDTYVGVARVSDPSCIAQVSDTPASVGADRRDCRKGCLTPAYAIADRPFPNGLADYRMPLLLVLGGAGECGTARWREGRPRRGPRAPGGAPEPNGVAGPHSPAPPRTPQERIHGPP